VALSYLLLDELAVGASARVAARAGSCPGVGARPICHRSRHVGAAHDRDRQALRGGVGWWPYE
jgi:hypothetical protein